jgi:hypothetical protein
MRPGICYSWPRVTNEGALVIHMNVTLRYTEALVRRAAKHFCWQQTGLLYVMVSIGLISRLARGDHTWLTGVFGTILVFGVLLPVALYRAQLAGALERYRVLDNQLAQFKGDESFFVGQSAAGSNKLPWTTIASVRRYEALWLLVFRKAGFMTFPLEGVPTVDRDYLIDRVTAHGGRVH